MIGLKIFHTSVPVRARANRNVAGRRQPMKKLFSYDVDLTANRIVRRILWRLTIPG